MFHFFHPSLQNSLEDRVSAIAHQKYAETLIGVISQERIFKQRENTQFVTAKQRA
jgi:hypothetical protein